VALFLGVFFVVYFVVRREFSELKNFIVSGGVRKLFDTIRFVGVIG